MQRTGSSYAGQKVEAAFGSIKLFIVIEVTTGATGGWVGGVLGAAVGVLLPGSFWIYHYLKAPAAHWKEDRRRDRFEVRRLKKLLDKPQPDSGSESLPWLSEEDRVRVLGAWSGLESMAPFPRQEVTAEQVVERAAELASPWSLVDLSMHVFGGRSQLQIVCSRDLARLLDSHGISVLTGAGMSAQDFSRRDLLAQDSYFRRSLPLMQDLVRYVRCLEGDADE